MALEYKEVEYENFGKCLSISNENLKLLVTVDLGPRIIYFGLNDGKNVLFNDIDRNYIEDLEVIKNYYGEEKIRYRYGGHKMLTLPEIMPDSFYPDNNPLTYSITPNGAVFFQEEQEKNDISISLEILLNDSSNDVMIIHTLKNTGKIEQEIGISASSDMNPNGTLIIPQNKSFKSEFLPNRSFAFWPYSKTNDKRLYLGNDFITIKHDKTNNDKFKFGLNNYSNWAAYINDDNIFIKNYVHNKNAKYPDFNSSFEVFVDENLLEIKSLSPIYTLEPQNTIKHVENWSLFECLDKFNSKDEKTIKEIINKY